MNVQNDLLFTVAEIGAKLHWDPNPFGRTHIDIAMLGTHAGTAMILPCKGQHVPIAQI